MSDANGESSMEMFEPNTKRGEVSTKLDKYSIVLQEEVPTKSKMSQEKVSTQFVKLEKEVREDHGVP